MVSPKLKVYYSVALCQTISPDNKFLFVGTNFGDIIVYSIEKLLEANSLEPDGTIASQEEFKSRIKPIQIVHASEKSQIYSLSFFNNFLIVGTNGELIGYSFSKQQIQDSKTAWEIRLPAALETSELVNEVNYLWLDEENASIYAGCGDNNIYGISLENGIIVRTFNGHSDYIHSLDGTPGNNQIVSASEDGTVRFWDVRQKRSTSKLEPHKKDQLTRPEFGKWVGTVSISEDWLVCGGGPKFSLWHLRTHELTNPFEFSGKVHDSAFIGDRIVVAGDSKTLHQYSFNGDLVAEIPVSSPSVYSLAWINEPTKFLTIGGSSNQVDVCTNFAFRDFSLQLYSV